MDKEELKESNERLLRSNRRLLNRIGDLENDNDVLKGKICSMEKERNELYDDVERLFKEKCMLEAKLGFTIFSSVIIVSTCVVLAIEIYLKYVV